MILGDLLRLPVVDRDGRVGSIIDVRFVLDGGPAGPLLDQARLLGLIISPHSKASIQGYERSDVRSPWPIARFERWRHRGAFLAHWEDVEQLGPDTVRLRDGYRRRDPRIDSAFTPGRSD